MSSSPKSSESNTSLPRDINRYLFTDTSSGKDVAAGTPGAVRSAIGTAQSAYQNVGNITNEYGLTAAQQGALDSIIATAGKNQAGDTGTAALDYYQALIGSGGLNDQQKALANSLITSSYADNPAYAGLASLADGSQIGKNPYTDDLLKRANDATVQGYQQTTVPTLDNSFLASGRGGSGLYASQRNTADQTLAEQLGQNATTLYGAAYDADRNRQLTALGQINDLYQGNVANRLSGSDLFQVGVGNVGSAVQGAGDASALQGTDYQTIFNAGQQQTASAYDNVSQYINLLLTAAGKGGTTVSTTTGGPSQVAKALTGAAGGALSGAAVGSSVPAIGTTIGAVGGAAVGALGGYYS